METLKINGREKHYPADKLPKTLVELLEQMNMNQATVVAEINGTIIEQKDFAQTAIKPGQSIELVRFVGGG